MTDKKFQRKLEKIKKRGERYKKEKELKDVYAKYVPEKKKRKISNIVLALVLAIIIAYTIACFWITYVTGMTIDPTLTTCVYSFFGSELFMLLILKATKIVKGTDYNNDQQDYPHADG